MFNLLLFRTRNRQYFRHTTSYGIGMIGTLAKEEGCNVKIIDNNSIYKEYDDEEFLEIIDQFSPNLLGFNINLYNFFTTIPLVKKIKERFPNLLLIAGGIHSYSEPEEMIDHGFDIVTRGDADVSFPEALRILKEVSEKTESLDEIDLGLEKRLENVQGLLFKTKDGRVVKTGVPKLLKDLDSLPFVDFRLFNLNDFLKTPQDFNNVVNHIAAQRGCPFSCNFCAQEDPAKTGSKQFRDNSGLYKARYVQYLYEEFGCDHFIFLDSVFCLKQKSVIDFVDNIKKMGLDENIEYSMETTIGTPMSDELFDSLKQLKWREIAVGVERLTDFSIKQSVQKNHVTKRVYDNLERCREADFKLSGNVLIGFPYDNKELIEEETKLFFDICDYFHLISAGVIIPAPGTGIYKDTNKKKWYLDKKIMNWKPSYYHLVYNYYSGSIEFNFFDLKKEDVKAVRTAKEVMYKQSLINMKSPTVLILFSIEKFLASISLFFYKLNPKVEQLMFGIVIKVRGLLWNFFVNKFYRNS